MEKEVEAVDSEPRLRARVWVLKGGTWFPPLLEKRGPTIDSREPEVSTAAYSVLKLKLTMSIFATVTSSRSTPRL